MPQRPDFIPKGDWDTVVNICKKYGQDPYLIAAMGWHETHWGRLGAGRDGYYLGWGVYPGSPYWPKTKAKAREAIGVANQVRHACEMLKRFDMYPLTYVRIENFAKNGWKPGNPVAWAKSVWSIYQRIKGGETISYPTSSLHTTEANRIPVDASTITILKKFRETLLKIIRTLRRGI